MRALPPGPLLNVGAPRPRPACPQELALQAGLADCYQQGLVREVGVSNYGPQQLRKIQKALAKREVPLASAQVGGHRGEDLWGRDRAPGWCAQLG